MESLQDPNCYSLSDNFSLYERYMKSFNVGGNLTEGISNRASCDPQSANSDDSVDSRCIDLTVVECNFINKHSNTAQNEYGLMNTDQITDKDSSLDVDICLKIDSPSNSIANLSFENSSTTIDRLSQDKSNHTEAHGSSEESYRRNKQPVFITPTMENSNNAVDSVPLFRDVIPSESVFKLPISELSFNGTIKHVKTLKPIVDPITALTSNTALGNLDDKSRETLSNDNDYSKYYTNRDFTVDLNELNMVERSSENGDSHCIETNSKRTDEGGKWSSDQSYTSFEASFDSGVRSPDLFSDSEYETAEPEPFWGFLKDYEDFEKKKVKRIEMILQGVPPPPSVTFLKTDITDMLKKYYNGLPLFNNSAEVNTSDSKTPIKGVSFVEIPQTLSDIAPQKAAGDPCVNEDRFKPKDDLNSSNEADTSLVGIDLKMSTEIEAKDTSWPQVLKCRYHDIYYNVTKFSEKYESLALKYRDKYIGSETDTSVNIYSGARQSPSSASKRKAQRLLLAQTQSPSRRLSHLALRRRAFCSAAIINEKAHTSTAKIVLIDKNFFPHRKLISSAERKSPRTKRTPGGKNRRTPGKKTPAKTPKTRSGGSSKKKAMRRLLMDSEALTRSQSRETLKRALFISPENKKVPQITSASVPSQGVKSRQRLFGSPDRQAETKSSDGTQSDLFLKRKLDSLDYVPESSRSKIAKSLSFGGDDTAGGVQSVMFSRRSSEVLTARNTAELNESHKKKLLWAVSEALRIHGWRMSSPGFKEKASSLARLTRRLLALPQHAAKLAAPKLSTSETMLKIARQYVFAIIQGRSVDDCYQEEQKKLANEVTKVTGYISASAYQQMKINQSTSAVASQIKENACAAASMRLDQPKSGSKNILQDKLINIDSNSNSSSGLSVFDKPSLGLFKSNSMPSFEEAAKLRVRRQISFDNANFPKR